MGKRKKRTIFSTEKEFICSNLEGDFEFNCYDCDCTEMSFNDEKINLNKILSNNIIAIADLGLWNGRKSGYKVLGNNLNNILDISEDYFEVYSDGYNVMGTYSHHDGTNYIKFREIKKGVNIETFLNAIYSQKEITPSMLSRYTLSVLPYVNDIYGW